MRDAEGDLSGQAYLLPSSYAYCEAKTVFYAAYGGKDVATSQSVKLTARFANAETVNAESGKMYSGFDATTSATSLHGSKFVSATSIHEQTIGGKTYRKDLSA